MSILFYQLFLFFFKLGIHLLSPWNVKARLWRRGRKHIFTRLADSVPADKDQVVWMHCASLGEFEQGRPLLEKIRVDYPRVFIILTFFSSSGYETSKNYKTADLVSYLPMDSPANAQRFLDIVKPSLVLWVKYEYWYYYLREIRERKVPLLLISGFFKTEQSFFKWYGAIYKKMLGSFTHLFVQTDDSKLLLGSIGFHDNITVSGDTRFDRVIELAESFQPIDLIDEFCGQQPVIVAGSTWVDDEEEIDHFANVNPHIRFIIAPHEIDKPHMEEIRKLFHHAILYSELKARKGEEALGVSVENVQTPNVLIIDNIGMLSRLYKYATITYVGGGFGEGGVHNVLEAAVYGKPVIFGPVFDWYIEAEQLIESGGGITVANALELEALFKKLLEDKVYYQKVCEAARNYVYAGKGAKEKILDFIRAHRYISN